MRSKVYAFNSPDFIEKTITLAAKKSESKRTFAPAFAFYPPDGLTVNALKEADGELFVYCDDKKVYIKTADGYVGACDETFENAPDIIGITVTGDKRFLITDGIKSAITGKVGALSVPVKGDCFAVFAGMLFAASGRVIRFSAPFDFANFSVDLNLGGYFETEIRDGDVRYMAEQNGKLCVVCRHSIIYLTVFGDRTDYLAERLQTGYLDVKKDSVVKIGEKIFFITNGKLGELGSSLKTYDVLYADAVKNAGKAQTFGGYYILPFTSDGKFKTLYCDTDGDGFSAYAAEGGGMISDGGTFYDSQKNAFYTFTENSETVEADAVGGDFGTCALKAVINISLCCDGDGYITATGDFGERVFSLKKGCNVIGCNLTSKRFSFSQTGTFAEEIKIKYRIYGEV